MLLVVVDLESCDVRDNLGSDEKKLCVAAG